MGLPDEEGGEEEDAAGEGDHGDYSDGDEVERFRRE